jgi:tetratricopeptide (TPR) repeat protein
MPRRTVNQGRSGLPPLLLVLSALGWSVSALGGQELPLKRDVPGSGPYQCPPVAAPDLPGRDARTQARQLASNAAQAVILGDLDRARALLDRATELDPTSSDLAYRRARVLQELGDRSAAVSEFCRVLSLDPAEGVEDARDRLEALVAADRVAIPDSAVQAFREGLSGFDAGLLERAVASFDSATARAPQWADAVYDRGVVLARLGRRAEAARDLRRYLELHPDAPDGIAVSERIGELQSVTTTRMPSPGAALTLGIMIPGMGQFYSGRALGGMTVLALAGGAVAAGMLIEDVQVRCLTDPGPDGSCPPGQVLREDVSRPYQIAGLGTAAAITLIGAIEAFVHLRGLRGGEEPAAVDVGPATLGALGVAPSRGRVDFRLVRVAF